MMGIYEIVNWQDGKASTYVGSSTDIECRWGEHRKKLRAGRHDNAHLQAAWDKYGKDAFAFNVLEEVSEDMLLAMEQEYLDDYFDRGHCYNIAVRAMPPMAGWKHTEEARRKMSETKRGKKLSEEHKRKIGESLMGNQNCSGCTHTEETKRNMGEAQKGRKHTEETRRKISAANKGKRRSEETRRRLSEAHRGNQNCLGRRVSEETRRKMGRDVAGEHNPMWGKHHTEEAKRKMSESRKRHWANRHAQETKDAIH